MIILHIPELTLHVHNVFFVIYFSVVVLLDMSVSNVNYLVHIQHSLRLLMEQQLANKDYFNIIA